MLSLLNAAGRSGRGRLPACAVFALAIAVAGSAHAATFKTLHKFSYDATNGRGPESVLVKSGASFYGTTTVGGKNEQGTVFELRPIAGGKWKFTILRSFKGGDKDGTQPTNNLSVQDGVLFGATDYGGEADYGTAYRLQKQNGKWVFKLLYSFINSGGAIDNPTSGILPVGKSLFGVSYWGGSTANGAAYQLKPAGGGYSPVALEPANPDELQSHSGDLVAASDTLLYGVTEDSDLGVATVFQIAKSGSAWTVTRIFTFDSSHDRPDGPLLLDKQGRLYGILRSGGTKNAGSIFRLQKGGDTWTVTYLHEFGGGKKGATPDGGLISVGGNLFGVTQSGGQFGNGTIFKLTKPKPPSTAWTHSVLHSFKGGAAGALPVAGLTLGKNGTFYGVTANGGTGDAGTIFEFKP